MKGEYMAPQNSRYQVYDFMIIAHSLACPTEYKKGPDIMSKSDHTQHHYARAWADQTTLDSFLTHPTTSTTGTGHECIFLLKFHCELNPIEMVSYSSVIKSRIADCKLF